MVSHSSSDAASGRGGADATVRHAASGGTGRDPATPAVEGKRTLRRGFHRGRLVPTGWLWVGLLLLAVFTLLPFLYLVSSSLATKSDLLSGYLVPHHLIVGNYLRLLAGPASTDFLKAMRNSTVVALVTTAAAMLLGIFAAYAFARIRFPYRITLLFLVLGMQLLPSISILTPMYITMRNGLSLHIPFTHILLAQTPPLLDTPWALVIAYTTFSLPFVIWLLSGYFQTIPADLEEASYVDGCNRLRSMFQIVLPLAIPGIAATAIFTFLQSWDEFMFANALTQTYASKTLPIAISEFIGRHSMDWGLITAGGVVASLPPVVISLVLYRYIVGGLTMGGIKA